LEWKEGYIGEGGIEEEESRKGCGNGRWERGGGRENEREGKRWRRGKIREIDG
jgi:hypothetical protein